MKCWICLLKTRNKKKDICSLYFDTESSNKGNLRSKRIKILIWKEKENLFLVADPCLFI